MQNLARKRGGRCLSETYISTDTKLKWECRKGHLWEAVPYSIKKGHWCPRCAGLQKLTIEEMRTFAESKGGRCLSDHYVNALTKLRWQCKNRHEWEAMPAAVKKGTWCPKCARKQKLTIEEMRENAKKRGGKCLSYEYVNVATKLLWRCEKGHEWWAKPNSIRNGAWCPKCAGLQKLTIEEMREIARERGGKCLSEQYVNGVTKLKWQCSKGHVWEAVPTSVKYGRWCMVCARKPKGMICEMREVAISRGGKCLSKRYINSFTKLKWMCKKGHIWMAPPKSVKHGHWCQTCAIWKLTGHEQITIMETRKMAEERGGVCVSEKYVNAHTKLRWQCKNGHEWEMTPNNVRSGQWCPKCAGKQRLTIGEMQSIAEGRGGKCLSEEYINSQTKLKWTCSKGHIWEAIPAGVKQGKWCRRCAAKQKWIKRLKEK